MASSLTSIHTEILRGEVGEGRRTYAVYGKKGMCSCTTMSQTLILSVEYGFPMDERELERLDICHTKYFALLEKKRFLSPIGEVENPQRILDLGCGTGNWCASISLFPVLTQPKIGSWCLDVADTFPSAVVRMASDTQFKLILTKTGRWG